jgi:hypothetical protein
MADRSADVYEAIDRWETAGLLDPPTVAELRSEVSQHADASDSRLSQYVLASTGAVILVIAGGVFLDWAWPLLDARARTFALGLTGLGVVGLGTTVERAPRWRPAGLLMQTAGVGLLLSAYVYSERAWEDQTLGATIVGLAALVTPIVLTGPAMRRSVFMPAVHMAAGLAFLGVFLDRSTPLSGDAIVWALDAVLALAIATMVSLLLRDPEGERHPWALNAFVVAIGAGFVLVSITAFDTLRLSNDGLLALDAWLLLSAGLTLWGVHRAPPGLKRAWFGRLLAWQMLAWIGLGLATAFETLDGPPELGLVMVGGAGVLGFAHAARHGLRDLMGAAALAFIIPVWWWAIDRGGALGGVAALLGTAALLFWLSGRRDRLFKAG